MINTRVRVLLVEDNPGDARLIQESLADSATDRFDIVLADRLATALSRLREGGIDAILLDLALPDSNGRETFDKTRAQAPSLPIIVLTGLGDDALALKMIREGAQDYVAKMELNGSILARAIRYSIEREHTEQQMRKFNEELDNRVKTRTAELEIANRELESFSYSVSHDLRSPLRRIDGYATLLSETHGPQLDAEGNNYIAQIQQGAKQMASTIDDLLRLARIGREKLDIRRTDLGHLVDRVLTRLAQEAEGRQIAWVVPSLQSVNCDPGLIEQVFLNLLGNSIKYTGKQLKPIIELGQTVSEGRLVTFVRDNGSGFDMKNAERLFVPFQRLHSAEEFEGTGIGLAIVQRIIERHGGRIWAESAPGQGSTFYFTLCPAEG